MTSTSSSNKRLFLIGPGFIGGTLLVRLRETRPDISLFALTRREDQAKELQALGITPVHGSLDDAKVIQEQAEQSDIIIHTATADHLPSAQAVVDGIKARKDQSRKVVYIHTSGNDELQGTAKQLKGKSVQERTLSDAQGDEVLENGRIGPDSPHRQVDGPLREQLFNDQDEKKYNASTTIMMPPLIYGIGAEPWKRISIQAPMLLRQMVKNGLATLPDGHPGTWNAVSVHDLAEAYLVLLKELEQHQPGTPQPSHYCFPAEPQVFSLKDLTDVIAQRLQQFGYPGKEVKVLQTSKVFEQYIGGEENGYAPYFAAIVWNDDNSYTKPDRLDAQGFKHKAKGPVDSIKNGHELDELIKEELQKLQK